jgi:hypothetical protein
LLYLYAAEFVSLIAVLSRRIKGAWTSSIVWTMWLWLVPETFYWSIVGEIAQKYYNLRDSHRDQLLHVAKVYLLSPLLFGRVQYPKKVLSGVSWV